MRSFTFTREIARPPEDIFAFITDFSNAPRWRHLVRRMEVIGDGPVREGARVAVTLDVMGKERQVVSEVFAFEPPRRIGHRNVSLGRRRNFRIPLRTYAARHEGHVHVRRHAARMDVASAAALDTVEPRQAIAISCPRWNARWSDTPARRDKMTR